MDTAETPPPTPPQPKDVVDGIANRAAHRPLWKYLLVAGVFCAWCGLLLAMFFLGRP